MAEIIVGQSIVFNYVGKIQSIVLPAGQYKLEVWGAAGGNDGNRGGYGGYSTGIVSLEYQTTLFIANGGVGASSTTTGAGWNGGGNAGPSPSSGAGGGATHIATTNRGVLSNYANYRDEILIVAGGGGGGGLNGVGGHGGGTNGGANHNGSCCTQTSGYAFGQGQHRASGDGGGAGGGWYGGYASTADNGGGGGSGYIKSTLTSGSMTTGTNTGNGTTKITPLFLGYNIITKNCHSNTAFVMGGETVSITAQKRLKINNYPSIFTGHFISDKEKIFKEIEYIRRTRSISFRFKVPDDISEDITIEAIYAKARVNSNLYRDSFIKDNFEYKKIVGDNNG